MTRRHAWFVFGLLIAVEFFALVSARGMPWRGEWNSTLDHVVGATVLTGPLVGAFAAWISAGDRQRAALVDSTVNGWLAPVRAAALAAGVGVVATAVALAGAVIATLSVPHGGPVAWWLPFVVVPLLGLNAMLGAVVGHLWPHRVVVVMVAPGLFFLGALAEFDVGPRGLRQGPVSGSLAGQGFNALVIGLQALFMVAAVVVVVAALAWRRRVAMSLAAAVGIVAGAVVIAASVQVGGFGDGRLVRTDERPTACAGKVPRVCLLPSNRRSLEPVRRQLERAARPLIDAGADVPATYLNAGPIRRGPLDAGVVLLPAEANVATYPLTDAAQSISRAAPCDGWYSDTPPPDEAFEAQGLVGSWVLVELGKPIMAWSPEAERWLRETPPEKQEETVVALFDQLRRCRLDAVTLPWQ